MKIKLNPAAISAALVSVALLGNEAFGSTTTTSTNGVTMSVALIDAEPPLGPNRSAFDLNVMPWEENGSRDSYIEGYSRNVPSDIVPNQDMWRTWDVIFSTVSSYHMWNCISSPTNQYSDEYGTMLEAPLVIGTTNDDMTFSPSNIWYQWSSSDGPNNAFGGISGQLAILSGSTNTIQSWSTTCVGILITNGVTNVFESGLMTNRVNRIYYSGVYGGFGVTDSNSMLYASNYCVGYWPFNISARYTLTDDSGSNIICQATASLDSEFHWHYGSLTNAAVVLSIEAWDYQQYQINTYTNNFSHEVPYAQMGDGTVLMNTNASGQWFRASAYSSPQPLALSRSKTFKGPPPIFFHQ